MSADKPGLEALFDEFDIEHTRQTLAEIRQHWPMEKGHGALTEAIELCGVVLAMFKQLERGPLRLSGVVEQASTIATEIAADFTKHESLALVRAKRRADGYVELWISPRHSGASLGVTLDLTTAARLLGVTP